jgi:hypothetical protein
MRRHYQSLEDVQGLFQGSRRILRVALGHYLVTQGAGYSGAQIFTCGYADQYWFANGWE